MTRWTTTLPSPVGPLRLVADEDGALTHLLFEIGDQHPPGPPAVLRRDPGPFREVATQLEEYFAGTRRRFELALAPRGSDFQLAAWRALRQIPYAATRSYGWQARTIGRPGAARAVGAADGRNPIAVVVPCHRVVGADRRLTGYGGGIARKRWLLAHEQDRAGQPALPLPLPAPVVPPR